MPRDIMIANAETSRVASLEVALEIMADGVNQFLQPPLMQAEPPLRRVGEDARERRQQAESKYQSTSDADGRRRSHTLAGNAPYQMLPKPAAERGSSQWRRVA